LACEGLERDARDVLRGASRGGTVKRRIALFILVIFLVACAAPAPAPTATSQPTSAPAPTKAPAASPTAKPAAPTPTKALVAPASKATPPPIKLQDVKKSKQPDGSSLTSASVMAPENLGLGQIELAAPETMRLDETRALRLRLSPAQQLVSLTPVAAPGKTPDIPNFVYRFSGNVQLYPLMFAELRALAFEIDQKGPVHRVIEANKSVEWVWVVKPLMVGRHELTVELAIPVIINGVATEMSTQVLQDLTVAIQVSAPPAVPTATPRSTMDRIGDSIVDHSGAIIAALIGILGTLLGALFALWRRRA